MYVIYSRVQSSFFSFKRANLYVSIMSVVNSLECETTVTHSFWQVQSTNISCTQCTVRQRTVRCTTGDWKIAQHQIKAGTVWGSINRYKIDFVNVRHCLERNFLSNPRRIHSEEEDEEKEGLGLPGALICCSPTSPPSPLSHCAPAALPGAAISGHTPPPPLHSTFPWTKINDFQESG